MWQFAHRKIRKFLLPQIREFPLFKPIDIWGHDLTAKNSPLLQQPDYLQTEDQPQKSFHDFSWLAEFYKSGGLTVKKQVLHFMNEWMNKYPYPHPEIWSAEVMSKRLQNWIIYFQLISDDQNEIYQQKLFKSINAQVHELYFLLDYCEDTVERLQILSALTSISVCFLTFRKYLKKFLFQIEKEVQENFFADGSSKKRNPSADLDYLKLFIEIRAVLYAGQQEVPAYLVQQIQNLVDVVHFSRHQDGGLCILNGSDENDPRKIDMILRHAHAQAQSYPKKLDNGLVKLKSNQVTMLIDCGDRTYFDLDKAHISPLAFELSVGRTRVFTHCGAAADQEKYKIWQEGLHSSAAHSTLTVRRESPDMPYDVEHYLSEQQGHMFLKASHAGYKQKFGITHLRHLYLSPEGDNIVGEDILEGAEDQFFDIRFHLHPHVLCSQLPKKNQLLLRLPDGSGWRFIANVQQISLQESVYFGYQGQKKRTDQIVIAVQGEDVKEKNKLIRWSLKKIH